MASPTSTCMQMQLPVGLHAGWWLGLVARVQLLRNQPKREREGDDMTTDHPQSENDMPPDDHQVESDRCRLVVKNNLGGYSWELRLPVPFTPVDRADLHDAIREAIEADDALRAGFADRPSLRHPTPDRRSTSTSARSRSDGW